MVHEVIKNGFLDEHVPTIRARYAVQRDLYALAAAARGAPVETAYVFLERPDPPVRESLGEAELESARARVEAVLQRLGEGRFDVTDRPHKSLCLDCPARARLCSHEPAAQLRESPEPPIEPAGDRATGESTAADETAAAGNGDPQLSLLEES